MKKSLFKILILATLVLFNACNSEKEQTAISSEDCTSSSGCSDSNITILTPSTLSIELENTEFYNANLGEWVEFPLSQETSDIVDLGTVSVFSDNISLTQQEAMSNVIQSDSQFNNQAAYDPSVFNTVFYIKAKAKNNVTYLVNYQKLTQDSKVIKETTFVATKVGSYIYIPIVNEQFSGKLQTTTISSSNTSSFTHVIKMAATSDSTVNDQIHKTIKFKLLPQTKLQGIKMEYSEEASAFNLKNRWNHYFNGVDYAPNTNFDIVSLIDDQEYNESIPYDIKVVFKNEPVLKMKQSVFVEETVDIDLYRETKEISPQRGESFIVSTNTYTSDAHFQKKIKINNTEVELDGGREGIHRNIQAGNDWKITFSIDFTQNSAYNPTLSLLTPLKPMCQQINNQSFYPINLSKQAEALEAQGGKAIICHPATHKKEFISSGDLTSTNLELTDLWYDFFFYRPSQTVLSSAKLKMEDAGSFYGIKEVKFFAEGCMQIYTREASSLETNPNTWEMISQEDDQCSSEGDSSGWTYFSFEIGDNIFNHRSNYSDNTTIVNLIEKLTTLEPKTRVPFSFNKSTEVERIY